MIDRQPTHAGRVQLVPVAGQTNIYDLSMADDPIEQGTPLNKATLLKDATAALYGLTDAVPDDVFAWLGNKTSDLHVWKRRTVQQRTQIALLETSKNVSISNSDTKYYSDAYSADFQTGVITLTNPSTQTVNANVRGHYWIPYSQSGEILYYSSSSAAFTSTSIIADVYTAMPIVGAWEYINNANRNAHPDSGISGGYEYAYLGKVGSALDREKSETGSYVGTGTYGVSNPNSLTFSFAPKLVWIYSIKAGGGFTPTDSVGQNANPIIPVDTMPTSYTSGFGFYASGGASYSWGKVANDKKTISWYSTSTAAYQLNTSNVTYSYIAIG